MICFLHLQLMNVQPTALLYYIKKLINFIYNNNSFNSIYRNPYTEI